LVRLCAVHLPFLLLLAGTFEPTQAKAEGWQKSYPVSGKPQLVIGTGDASVELHRCGACRAVRIEVNWRERRPSDFLLKESQSGDQIRFQLDERSPLGIHFTVGNRHAPQVTVETPAALDLEAKTGDGALKISGVQGSLQLHTADGAVDIEDVTGAVRLTASDGTIKIHNLTGTLESRSSDGHATIDGKFTGLQVHTSDGNLDLTVEEGSQLATPSRIESSDGHVTVRLPRALPLDLDVQVGDGKVECALPVMTEGFNSERGERGGGHNLRGRLNRGGPTLTIRTQDGNVTIAAL